MTISQVSCSLFFKDEAKIYRARQGGRFGISYQEGKVKIKNFGGTDKGGVAFVTQRRDIRCDLQLGSDFEGIYFQIISFQGQFFLSSGRLPSPTSLFIIALLFPMLHKTDIPMTHPESVSLFQGVKTSGVPAKGN